MFWNHINKPNDNSEENKVDKTQGLLGTAPLAYRIPMLCKNIAIPAAV
jgi:hypothetical protein